MTFYYQHTEPMYYSLTVFARTTTIFTLVLKRFEFYFFVFIHIVLVAGTKSDVIPVPEIPNLWESVSASQFFMIFFLTFFNNHCFQRFLKFYNESMNVIDSVLMFVHEIVVALPEKEHEKHRISATKYMLAMLYLFFMNTVGGRLTIADYKEIVKKGLLTKAEADQLRAFPCHTHENSYVLVSWAMQVVDKALMTPIMYEARRPAISHCHNRAQKHATDAMKACNEVSNLLALPIPFPYFHLMNAVIVLNAIMLAGVGAFFKTYYTIPPLAIALLFFMGLREISTSLADPFGPDDMDFPIASFMEYAFDNSVCLLEAFREPEAWDVSKMLERCHEFSDSQLRKQTKAKLLYHKNFDPATSNPFSWTKEMPLQSLAGTQRGPANILRYAMTSHTPPVEFTQKVGKSGGQAELLIESDSDEEADEAKEKEEAGGKVNPIVKLAKHVLKKASNWMKKNEIKKKAEEERKAKDRKDNSKAAKLKKQREAYEGDLVRLKNENEDLEQELKQLSASIDVLGHKVKKMGLKLPDSVQKARVEAINEQKASDDQPKPLHDEVLERRVVISTIHEESAPPASTKQRIDFEQAREQLREATREVQVPQSSSRRS